MKPIDEKVTVVIPTRNRAQQLEHAVQSAVRQTHSELEVVVVDGGSTDDTPHVIEQLDETTSTQITYLRNESPCGLPAARNQGVRCGDSDYVAFLDDDDEWHPEKINRQITTFRRAPEPVGAVHTGFRSETSNGKHIHTKQPTHEGDIYESLLVRNVIGPPSTVMVRRQAFEEVNGFDEQLHHQEDWDFYIRLARKYKFSYVSDPLVTRLVHDGTMSADVVTQKRYREQVLRRYDTELEERNLKSAAWAAHHRKAGITSCRNNDSSQGRHEFRRSLQLEWDLPTTILYCATLFGDIGFNTLVQSKRLIVTTLNRLRAKQL